MRVWPSPARCSTAAATPGASSWQTAGNGLGTSGRLSVTAWSLSSCEQRDPRIVEAQVGEDHAVHALAAREMAVAGQLLLEVVADHVQQQRLAAVGELELDARDEGREERVGAQQQRIARDHEADRVLLAPAERAGGRARLPAELVGDPEDPVAGRVGHAGAAVERERDGGRRDARVARHVDDRRSAPAFARSPHAGVYPPLAKGIKRLSPSREVGPMVRRLLLVCMLLLLVAGGRARRAADQHRASRLPRRRPSRRRPRRATRRSGRGADRRALDLRGPQRRRVLPPRRRRRVRRRDEHLRPGRVQRRRHRPRGRRLPAPLAARPARPPRVRARTRCCAASRICSRRTATSCSGCSRTAR